MTTPLYLQSDNQADRNEVVVQDHKCHYGLEEVGHLMSHG